MYHAERDASRSAFFVDSAAIREHQSTDNTGGENPAARKLAQAVRIRMGMIVTIDGPAGAGKSSAARRWRRGSASTSSTPAPCTGPSPAPACAAASTCTTRRALAGLLAPCTWSCRRAASVLNGEDVDRPSARRRSRRPPARSRRQPGRAVAGSSSGSAQMAAGRDVVCEGRDQGTIVFPDAVLQVLPRRRPGRARRAAGQEMPAARRAGDVRRGAARRGGARPPRRRPRHRPDGPRRRTRSSSTAHI